MEKVFERSYGDHLQLQGVVEHFFDSLCGEFNTSITDETDITSELLNGTYESRIILDNGKELQIEVSLWEFDDKELNEKNYEWNCFAYKVN